MDMNALMLRYGVDTAGDVGRRNNFLSWVQEHLVAHALGVQSDGRVGQPDIMLGSRPIECRIASPRIRFGLTLVASWAQVEKHEQTDFVYIVAARDLLSFAFLHIVGVTIDDFNPKTVSKGAKAHMVRSRVLPKIRCLHGEVREVRGSFRIFTAPL
jgi:hypothetical protein